MNGKMSNPLSFRRGDENRPPPPDFSKYPVEWYSPHPGSLSEGAGSPKG